MYKSPIPRGATLTSGSCRDRIATYAGVVELVDSLDLGAVTSVKVFLWK